MMTNYKLQVNCYFLNDTYSMLFDVSVVILFLFFFYQRLNPYPPFPITGIMCTFCNKGSPFLLFPRTLPSHGCIQERKQNHLLGEITSPGLSKQFVAGQYTIYFIILASYSAGQFFRFYIKRWQTQPPTPTIKPAISKCCMIALHHPDQTSVNNRLSAFSNDLITDVMAKNLKDTGKIN